jgi:hypothetical protein
MQKPAKCGIYKVLLPNEEIGDAGTAVKTKRLADEKI